MAKKSKSKKKETKNQPEAKGKKKQKDEISLLQEENKNLKNDVEKFQDKWRRSVAEFDNFRKRSLKERKEWIKYANRNLVLELIEVLENMEKALGSIDHDKKSKNHSKGIKLVYDQFAEILKKQGLKKMEVIGEEFDPQLHDALIFTPNEDFEENTIFDCVSNGYFLDDKVLLHARVAVTKAATNDEEDEEDEEDEKEDFNTKNNKNEVNDNE